MMNPNTKVYLGWSKMKGQNPKEMLEQKDTALFPATI